MIALRLGIFGKNTTEMMFFLSQVHYIKGHMIPKCLTTGDGDIDHLFKVLSAGFP